MSVEAISWALDLAQSRRSGEANAPKFDRCACPHDWASSSATGVLAKSAAMILGAPR